MGLLTRGQIIAEGLSQVGRTDLTSNARLWLNVFLEKIYRTQDWAWLQKESAVTSLTDGMAMPADYRAMKVANLLYNGVIQREVVGMFEEEYYAFKRQGTLSGQPNRFYADQQARTFKFWPVPDLNYTWQYFYYYMPTLPDPTSSGGDSAVPVWGEHDDLLIRSVQLKGLYFNDDARYAAEEKDLMDELISAKINTADFRAGRNRLKMGKSFRRRF